MSKINGLKKIRTDLIHFPTPFRIIFLPADNLKIYKTIILSVVLYGCKPWSLTLIKKHRLRVFENRVLGKIFGPRKDEITGEWRRLKTEDLYVQYSSSNIRQVKKNEMGRTRGKYGKGDMGIQGYRGET
jgi:hypothetical protein